jgi:8-oxo-dGTP pyrophosphatase MutT (NUDIX family)
MFDKENLPWLIEEALRAREPQVIQDENALSMHAAVLIPMFKQDDEYRVLFTKRTNTVEAHKGQISFPGGRVDEGDASLLETALREAYEEIGLHSKDVTILGRMDDTRTVASNYIVHPFAGLIPHPYAFKINREEVDQLISVPLEIFLDGSSTIPVDYQGNIHKGLAYAYRGEVIWGATARIMENLVDIVLSSVGSKPRRGIV